MKNKILKFSKGDFQLLKPDIVIDETNLVLVIGEGEIHKSSFSLKTESNRLIRGFLYASSERIKFKNQGFEGNPAIIEFAFDGRGLVPGYVENGKITVVSDAGEYEVSFTAIIEKPFVMTNYGKVQGTEDFRKLAVKDYNEAAKLFRSRDFYEILKFEKDRIFYLYDNMRKWELNEQAMEEFLVGIKQKECIFLTLSGEENLYVDLEEPRKGKISLVKNTWGFMPVRVKTEGTFINIAKEEFSTDDFIGNLFELEYEIDPSKLHKGRNFGKIIFVTPYESLEFEIEVLQTCESENHHKLIGITKAQLLNDYIDYAAGRMDIGIWIASASEKMNLICKLEPKNDFYQLVRANVYLLGQKKEEARLILENYNFSLFSGLRNPINNAYQLFLSAWLKGSASQMERALDEIYRVLSSHPDSWILLSMALTMDARLKSPYRKIELLEEYFEYGTREVLFYLEVFKCYKEKQSLLRELGKLQKEVLNFASKYGLMSKDMAVYVASVTVQQKSFDPVIYRILTRIYEQYEVDSILYAICTLLIKGNKFGPEYFVWYKKAVNRDIKIAQLYEFYMYSIDDHMFTELLPEKILRYYVHGNNLNHNKKAVLFANIVLFEEKLQDIYLGYEKQIVDFTWEQLSKRRISEALRILYKRYCLDAEMTDDRIDAIRDICYSYSIKTQTENINRVLVIENNGEIRQKVRYDAKSGAVVRLYDNDSRIVWESVDGHHYTDSIVFETKRLFYEPRFIELCDRYERSLMASDDEEKRDPSVEGIKQLGLKAFHGSDVLQFCVDKIAEMNEEDSFVLNLAFMLFEQGYYSDETLLYLAEHYCGPTVSMKRIWNALNDHDLPKEKLSESIITQAVFTESVVNDEKIFKDYYKSEFVYDQLKLAYLAYVSREYILNEKVLDPEIFEIMISEYINLSELPDACKIAVLEYYSDHEYTLEDKTILKEMMRELCEKELVFPFFMNYEDEWLKELLLYDKSMILYKAKSGSRVNLFYKLECKDGESLGYHSEMMIPVFENIYLKQFVLYKDESVKYYIQEFTKKGTLSSEKMMLVDDREFGNSGKFDRIQKILSLETEEQNDEIINFAAEEILAEEIFRTY